MFTSICTADFAGRNNLPQPLGASTDKRFASPYIALAAVTTVADPIRPWLVQGLLHLIASDGERTIRIPRKHVAAFLDRHRTAMFVMHGAAEQLRILHLASHTLEPNVYAQLDTSPVWCTRLLHRLLALGIDGVVPGNDESTLERCAGQYDLVDQNEAARLTENHSQSQLTVEQLSSAELRATITYRLFVELWGRHQRLFDTTSLDTFGRLTDAQRTAALHMHGWQTHHIQLRAEIVLDEITRGGLGVDLSGRDEALRSLTELQNALGRQLRAEGYIPEGEGSARSLQGILARIQRKHPGVEFPKTETGQLATGQEALEPIRGMLPFVDTLLKYQQVTALQRTLARVTRPRIHPRFDVTKVTGRTASFGEINAQSVPRDPRVRSVFVPSEGHVFLKFDYKMAELVALSGAIRHQFGLPSQMHTALSHGRDLHRLVAAAVTGKQENEVTDDERRKAKAINFGKPGGLGVRTLKALARASYGVEMTELEAVEASNAWLASFSEMDDFLANRQRARFFGLTGTSYFRRTGDRTFLQSGNEEAPHPILAAMLGRVLSDLNPTRGDGRPYSVAEIDYFWSRVSSRISELPQALHSQIEDRLASYSLRGRVMEVADCAPVMTLTGRLRANASYTAQRNTVFQGLAADAAKIALWWIWRAGYRIVNFVHDEILVEVPVGSNLRQHAERIQYLMVEAMRQIAPDAPINVNFAAMSRWYAEAEAVYSAGGELELWSPASR